MTSSDPTSTAPDTNPADVGSVVVIGAGPAGLTAAYELGKRGATATVLESDDVVGGISRTVVADGYRFDIGGHRFFTKVPEVEALWHEILPDEDFMLRPRSSRIYYGGKFYDYPIKVGNALKNLGPIEAVRCGLSFLWVRVSPPKDLTTLEGYIAKNYGWRLYQHFFKTYSEKVWGVPPADMSADWGAQRIKGMSLWSAVWEPIRAKLAGARKDKSKQVTSLIEQFQYPKYGPGMMWERCHELVEAQGSKVVLRSKVTSIAHRDGKAVSVTSTDASGATSTVPVDHVISSMPFPHLLRAMDPQPPAEVLAAADDLSFRDFLSVALVVPEGKVAWDDNWIYIHDPGVKTMRVQNFGSWSPYLVKDGRNVLGLEYTVVEGDEWWSASDEELIEKGKAELEELGLMNAVDVEAGYVVRMPKAYPTYDEDYKANVDVLRRWLESHAPNVHPIGRNGMHRYNNQDHSMYTAMLTVENIFGADHDIWDVNVDAEYHEESTEGSGQRGTGRDAPVLPKAATAPRG
ncbi:MAG TPA: NAD(P)/FAD-dependent oxidoreductase [Acidimicrobiales bacterium]